MRKNKKAEVVGFEQDANGIIQVTNGNEPVVVEEIDAEREDGVLFASDKVLDLVAFRKLLDTAIEKAAVVGCCKTTIWKLTVMRDTTIRKIDAETKQAGKTAKDKAKSTAKAARTEAKAKKLAEMASKIKAAGYSEADLAKLLGIKID
ncbi:MAG: hypothetical protein WC277_08075 [Bacilli bacterium]|jgi:hypothetical protein